MINIEFRFSKKTMKNHIDCLLGEKGSTEKAEIILLNEDSRMRVSSPLELQLVGVNGLLKYSEKPIYTFLVEGFSIEAISVGSYENSEDEGFIFNANINEQFFKKILLM